MIFLGLVRIFAYYQYFGIEIIPYLEISEILLSFLNYIVLIVAVLAISLAWPFAKEDGETIEYYETFIKRIKRVKSFKSRFKQYSEQILIPLLLLCVFVSICFVIARVFWNLFSTEIFLWNRLLYVITVIISFSIALIFYLEYEVSAYRNSLNNFKLRRLRLVSLSSLIFIIMVVEGTLEAWRLEKSYEDKFSKIILNSSEEIISNQDNFYIGKTKNYFFYYNNKDESYEVYPTSEIKKMIFNIPNSTIINSKEKSDNDSIAAYKSIKILQITKENEKTSDTIQESNEN